jgi:hypothetical protein
VRGPSGKDRSQYECLAEREYDLPAKDGGPSGEEGANIEVHLEDSE